MREIQKIRPEILSRFERVPTSWATDGLGRLGLGGWMDDVVPINPARRVHGRVRTVKFAPRSGIKRPHLSIYEIIRSLEAGDVLVLAAGGTRSWLMGENMAHLAMYQGVAGIVTDGRVRDVGELRELEIPVFSRGVSARPPADLELAAFDVPVTCGGAEVRPGDLLVGDIDGIVVAPFEAAEALAVEVEDLMALEAEQEKLIAARASMAEIRALLARKKQRKGQALEVVEQG